MCCPFSRTTPEDFKGYFYIITVTAKDQVSLYNEVQKRICQGGVKVKSWAQLWLAIIFDEGGGELQPDIG
jgi:hypothetical protein